MRVRSLDWEDPWRGKWQPSPAFLPGVSHGQRILVGYSPWGHMTEHACTTNAFSLAGIWYALILILIYMLI